MSDAVHPHATRSWLFTPATRTERFAKAAEVGADVLILDLEDAVAPGDKAKARGVALDYLGKSDAAKVSRALRINSIQTRFGLDDVGALLDSDADPDFIVLPKTEAAQDLRLLDRWLTLGGKKARLVGLIESARAVSALEALAQATPRLAALMFGAADMAADLGAETAWEPLLGVRQRIIAAAALSGVTPIDTPFFDIQDTEGLTSDVKRGVALGFAAKAAIHPSQVGPINQTLTPTDAAVKHAREVLAVNEKGVGAVDGEMIDEAVARKARRVLAAVGQSE